ncbi:hypothetical protein O181_101319 [Austropuccinia psidii MF-1]|uniref:Uncharacterized protein n=1 Tax=Austropuccinia psidii MF-1 TaxID=1389203 RepID=A0A9Q3PH76_9BASI|nr:hypothetical protein [Austropuccinia psidii MF-1]
MEDYDDVLYESTTIAFWMDQDGRIGGTLGAQHPAVMAQMDTAEHPAKLFFKVRKSLPVYNWRDRLLKVIAKYEGTIVVGDTGSGITSQLSQYDHQAACTKNRSNICSTQARHVPAMWVSGRVADEMGLRVGDAIGYSIRFEDCTSPKTVIKYMIDGMLLREHMSKPDLADQSFAPNQSQHENPSQPSSHNQITYSDSINAPSNPSKCDSSSISYSNSQKSAPKSCKRPSLPNLYLIQSYLHLNQDMINNTPIKSQPLSNDDYSIGAAFQPNYQIHPSQSLASSSSSSHLNPSSSSSITSNADGNPQLQFRSIYLLNQSHHL